MNQYKITIIRWDWDAIFEDLDGSLTGNPGDVVVSLNNITVNRPLCRDTGQYKNGIVCSQTKTWIRFAYKDFEPNSAMLLYIIDSRNRVASSPMIVTRLTHCGGKLKC